MNFSYRDINNNDFKEIININTKFESYLSPLDNSKLLFLIKESSFAKSIKVKQKLIGFLITIPPNSVYNSIIIIGLIKSIILLFILIEYVYQMNFKGMG